MVMDDGGLLVREARHRVANELAVAAAALGLAARGALSPEAMSSVVDRLDAAAAVNAVLCREPSPGDVDLAAELGVLHAPMGRLAASAGWSVGLDVGEVVVAGTCAARIALIVHELVANAIRHAEPVGVRRIEIVVYRADGGLRVAVPDGGSARAWTRPGGQGSRIVDALAGAMGGIVARGGEAGRSGVEVVLPAAAQSSATLAAAPRRNAFCTHAPAREGMTR